MTASQGGDDTQAPGDAAGARTAPPEPGAALQDQIRQAKEDFESHVAHAREQLEEANERIKERTGRDLILAILIGAALLAAVLTSLIFAKWTFTILAVVVGTLGTFELVRALQGSGRRLDVAPQVVCAAGLIVAGWFADLWLYWVLVFVCVALVIVWRILAQMTARDGRIYGDVLADVLISGLVQVYVPFLAGLALVLLRQENGEWWVLTLIGVAVAADTGAYASGLMFGKHPMAPRISPKKTWEGFAGGAILAVVAAVLFALFLLGLPIWAGIVIGVVILGSATLGDLSESMLKRDLGIKDMSSWIPGHGGVLDRLDSILPSAFAALALYMLLSPLAVTG